MKTFVFCGQGAQKVGMGKEYFEEFQDLVQKADNILGYSIEDLCLYDKEKQLNQTQFTQPALFVVSMLEYYSRMKQEEEPDYLIGHSIGEYAALCAAGAFSFEDGLTLVKERGRLMSMAKDGGMAAVVGMNCSQVEEVIKKNQLDTIDIANINSPTQVAISGLSDDIASAKQAFLDAGARAYIVLKVSGAFHSRYMKSAEEGMGLYIRNVNMKELLIPVISNYTARPYENGKIKNTLIPQITNSVQWVDTVRYLMGQDNMEFVSIGPSPSTIKLVKAIEADTEAMSYSEQNIRIKEVGYDLESDIQHEIQKKVKVAVHISENNITEKVGNQEFSKQYHTKYNYVVGGMCHGISGPDFVASACNDGILSFLGTRSVELYEVKQMIWKTRELCNTNTLFGINILKDYLHPDKATQLLEMCEEESIPVVEVSNYMIPDKSLVKYRLKGIHINEDGSISAHAVIAKVTCPEVAGEFLKPAPDSILKELLDEHELSEEEYELGKKISVANDICVVGDSAYETERGNLFSQLPEVLIMAKHMKMEGNMLQVARIGAAGGIGTGYAAAAVFYMGAEFILTGSVNECASEAALPEDVKEVLAKSTSGDFTHCPSSDLFELNQEVQVLKKGVFYPNRAVMLKAIYDSAESLNAISEENRIYIQNRLLKQTFDEYFNSIYRSLDESQKKLAECNGKYKMALIFKDYLRKCFEKIFISVERQKEFADFMIYGSQGLGSFNEAVKEGTLENYKNRTVGAIADQIMLEAYRIIVEKEQDYASKKGNC